MGAACAVVGGKIFASRARLEVLFVQDRKRADHNCDVRKFVVRGDDSW